ncbi:TRAP transporter small permease [Natronorarus salvus]|uniref:TRAP transporter small permease n=1 Tax=Natronorarus salvus TaxID=3117733 RepID=UPI002F263568
MEIDQSLDVKTDTRFDRAVLYTAMFFFSMTIVLVSVQVSLRYLPIQIGIGHWTEPLSRYMLIVGTFFGAAVAARNREHISMYFMLERVEARAPRLHAVLQLVVSVVVIGFLAIAVAAGITTATRNWGNYFGGVYIVTMGQMMALISTGLLLYLLYSLVEFRDRIRTAHERLVRGESPRTVGEASSEEGSGR